MALIDFLISFTASIVGAISGIGGGVIIKPALDVLTHYPVGIISFLSGNTVLAMTVVTLIRSRKSEIKLDRRVSSFLAAGGVLGGLAGKHLFDMIQKSFASDSAVSGTQSLILAILTLAVLFFTIYKERISSLNLKNSAFSLLTGLVLGGIASFLGIGGGPINLAVLYLFFSMDSKTAALNSIFIIFCSQLTNLIFTIASGNVPEFSLLVLLLMIAGGITGGLTGSHLSRRMSNRQVDYLFSFVMVIIIGISLFNTVNSFALLP